MKKIIMISLSLLLFFSFSMTSEAKTIKVTKSFVKSLKNGHLPYSKGKIGMEFGTLKKMTKGGEITTSDSYNWYHDKSFTYGYGFIYKKTPQLGKINNSEKITTIAKIYDGKVSRVSLSKHFKRAKLNCGQQSAKNLYVYKVGQNYLEVHGETETDLLLHTKKSFNVYGYNCSIVK